MSTSASCVLEINMILDGSITLADRGISQYYSLPYASFNKGMNRRSRDPKMLDLRSFIHQTTLVTLGTETSKVEC